jgi:protoporphyrinogen/coproporphyrinogen III oxidase
MTAVAVVGGGVAGLAAALDLAAGGAEVVLLEAGDRLGGKVRTGSLAGVAMDLGPDSFLARRPEAVRLCTELGLAADLVSPAATSAGVWSRGRVRMLPGGQVLGVPSDARALARSGIVSPLGAVRAALEPVWPGRPLAEDDDEAVGALVGRRFGREVAERLVDPLLGGINAGNTDSLSVDAAAPQLAAAARRSRSLVAGLRGGPAPAPGPVFLTHPSGLSVVVDALVARLGELGVSISPSCPVDGLEARAGGGYRLAAPGGAIDVDGVVVATPGPAAASVLAEVAPAARSTLAGVRAASVVLVGLAYRNGDAPAAPVGSGFLVPRPERRLMTACSWASAKWAHLGADGVVRLRVSAGRVDDPRALAMDDEEVVDRLRVELAAAVGVEADPLDVVVARWPDGFPQYAPGHLRRIAAVHAELDRAAPGVAVAGAALGGVGLPACIGSGRAAAARVLTALA